MQIIIEITDTEQKMLEHDLVDVQEWIKSAVAGKVNNCKKRLLREWQPRLFNDPAVISIPASDGELVALIIARPDYQNRVQRDVAKQEKNKVR